MPAAYTLPLQDYIAEQADVNISYRTLSAQFGDGYEQVAGDGINTTLKTWSIQYQNMPEASYATLMSFLETVKGHVSFNATPRGESAQVWRLIPDSIRVQHIIVNHLTGEVLKTVSLTLKKVYE